MLENGTISIIDIGNYKLNNGASKPARACKISKPDITKKNSSNMMSTIKAIETPKVEPVQTPKPVLENVQTEVTPVEEKRVLSKDTLDSRINNLGVVIYKGIGLKVANSEGCRKLRVVETVNDAERQATNLIGIDYPMPLKEEAPKEEVKHETFDFSQVVNMNKEEPKVKSIEDYWDKSEKDETKEENTEITTGDDETIVQISSLTKEIQSLRTSIDTQKEILANMREKVKKYGEMCKQKKAELEEEKFALTQELNDVLKGINESTDIYEQQKSFLEMTDENNSKTV